MLFESKVKIVEAREHALLWQERDVAAKEEELIEREEILKAGGFWGNHPPPPGSPNKN